MPIVMDDESIKEGWLATSNSIFLKELCWNRRQLLLQAYAPGCTARAIAERLGRSEDGLYQLIRRLRLESKDCVELGLAQEKGAT